MYLFLTGVGTTGSALDEDGVLAIDTTISLETTWHAMEDLVSKGLVRSIGIRYIEFKQQVFLLQLKVRRWLIMKLLAATMTSF